MLEFGPAHGASGLGFGRVVEAYSALEDLAFALGEIPVAEDGDGISWALGKETDEDKAGSYGEDSLDLESVRTISRCYWASAYDEQPLPTRQPLDASHVKALWL